MKQKVFRANETFVKCHKDTIKWFESPENCREYPKEFKKNKHAYRKKVSHYVYDKTSIYCSEKLG